MDKQLMISIPSNDGEEGLTSACRRGELFRNDEQLERHFRQGYRVHDYAIVEEKKASNTMNPLTLVKVFLRK
jgi:hypothetical protein